MTNRPFAVLCVAAAVASGVGALDLTAGHLTAPAAAQDYIQRANAPFRSIANQARSDTVLLPVLAKLEAPPKSVATPAMAALLPANSADFEAAAKWAQAAPQKAVLEALEKVTQEKDYKKAFSFGQPYGTEGITPEYIQMKMYTELGDPPLLAGAQHLYMPSLDTLVCLVNVEATRLAADGKPSDGIDLLIRLAYFARQMCERQFYTEVEWGMTQISAAMERIRDVAYNDVRGKKALDASRVTEQIARLSDDNQGYMELDRIKVPQGNRLAAEQLVERVYSGREINSSVFAGTMSRLGSTERPLRLFSEATRWKSVATRQVDRYAAEDKVKAVYTDFQRRWTAPYYDRGRSMVTEYSKVDHETNAVIDITTPDMNQLIELRQQCRVECSGARLSLAAAGFTVRNGQFPPLLTGLRPLWIPTLEPDPYHYEPGRTDKFPYEYFVPMQKPRNPREDPKPHEMQVFTANGEANFRVLLQNDVFVLYSHGTDNANDGALRIQNTTQIVKGADYLIWPPVLSLYRQYLIDRGDLKVSE
jgi:hypothetical protein